MTTLKNLNKLRKLNSSQSQVPKPYLVKSFFQQTFNKNALLKKNPDIKKGFKTILCVCENLESHLGGKFKAVYQGSQFYNQIQGPFT